MDEIKNFPSGKNAILANEPIHRLVLRFSAITLTSLLLNSIYTLTDALMVGWGIGANAMGALSAVYPFILLESALSTAIGGGAASLVSRKLGEGHSREAGEITQNARAAFYIASLGIMILGFLFLNPILRLMGVTDELYPYAKQYFIILLSGMLFSTGFSAIIRAEGKMFYSLLIWVIPIVLNILLDAVFIFYFRWGVAGAAAATVLGQGTSFLMSLLFFARFSVQDLRSVHLRRTRIREILGIGLPSLIQVGSLALSGVLMNNLLGDVGGTVAVNTYAFIARIWMFGVVPFTALSQAISPIVGYNFGAGRRDRVLGSVSFALVSGLVYAGVAMVLLELFPRQILSFFTDDGDILQKGAQGLRILAVALPLVPMPLLWGTAFQSVGNKGWSSILYGIDLLFLIPLAIGFSAMYGLEGIWWAFLFAHLGSAGISLIPWSIKTGVKADMRFL